MHHRIGHMLALAVALLQCLPATTLAATPKEVDNAINKAKAFLFSKQKDGNWESVPVPTDPKTPQHNYYVTGAQWGGLTSLATYALLASGEKPQEQRS